ncbi:MAG TPA: enoyl-CoA hydratase [Acidimicrobiales bacterium]|nr:enoyl-CoA hydratase [Acidimicrobiales bacterium]
MDIVTLEITPAAADAPPRAGGVAVITLNDPDKRNMLSEEMVDALVTILDRVEADESVGAIVVTGAGRAFCAGANLGNLGRAGEAARGDQPAADRGTGMRSIYEAFLRFSRSPLPTLAAVNGAAVGAGMNLALACDIRLAGRSARFDTRFLELGLHPGGGHTWMLQRLVGPQTAAAMVLFGQVLDAAAAAERGLVWSCVDDQELLTESIALAARAASGPRDLAMRIKATMGVVSGLDDHDAAVDAELEAQLWSLGQPFFAERLAVVRQRVSGGSTRSD